MPSVYETILDQVKTAVDGLALIPAPTVVRRKRFHFLEGDEAPLVVVFPLEEHEVGDGDTFELSVDMVYPVGIGIVLDGQTFGGNTEVTTMLTARQMIRRALRSVNVVGTSEAQCFNVDADLRPPFDRSAFAAAHDVSAMVINYTVQETRIT